MQSRSETASPFVGPRPFERTDSRFFFGRDKDAPRIVMRIISNRAFLLYAQSGAGKTSILNTKVIPLLEENGFEVFPSTQDASDDFSPIARVSGSLPLGLSFENVANTFIFNTLISWTKQGEDVTRLADMSLSAYLAEHEHSINADGTPRPRVIVFDQFEELFTAYPQYWQQQVPFFEQIKSAMQDDNALWVVFSLREDFIAHLDNYVQYFEDRLRGRYRLELLTREEALQAIKGPLNKLKIEFAPDVAEAVVKDLLQIRIASASGIPIPAEGKFVEPVQLQVACQSLWQNLHADTKVVTREFLEAFGGVDKALIVFYEQSIQTALKGTRIGEGRLRRWFERYLITPLGTRGNIIRGPETTGEMPNVVVDKLQSVQHILRSEERAGARWYELAHDRFVGPIQTSNRKWNSSIAQRRLIVGLGVVLVLAIAVVTVLYSTVSQQNLAVVRTQAYDLAATSVAETVTRNRDWRPQIREFSWGAMVLVPPGCWQMGSFDGEEDERPVNQYCFTQKFWIDRYEVTNAQLFTEISVEGQPEVATGPGAPRTSVTWERAQEFCRARDVSSRLPTEAEWEYAARGPDGLTYPWGQPFLPDRVIYQDNSQQRPMDVVGRPLGASWVGAMDMSGNVWEWTHTIYDPILFPYPYNPNDGREGEENANQRVARGGSYNSGERALRSSNRFGGDPASAFPDIGLRCVYIEP